jgi:hypothetical protein
MHFLPQVVGLARLGQVGQQAVAVQAAGLAQQAVQPVVGVESVRVG